MRIILFFLITFNLLNAQIGSYYQQKVEYFMDVDVDVKKFTYQGKQKIIYSNNSPDQLNVFYFHLYWNAFQPGSLMDERIKVMGENSDRRMIVKENGIVKSKMTDLPKDEIGFQKILSLKQNGKDVKFKVNETVLEVELNETILPNSTCEFEMTWEAQVPKQIRRSGRNNSEGIALSMTQWYPKVVEYDYEGWHAFEYIGREFHGVFGDFNVNISIDSDYIVAAGGQLQNPNEVKGFNQNFKTKNKKTTWNYKAENIHDFAWGADPDYEIEKQQIINGPLVHYVYQKNGITQLWESAKPKIQLFFDTMAEAFGKYPYPTYTFIQGGDGGMEYGQCTLIMGEATSLEGLVGLMYHEAGHSWFQQVIATNESMRGWMDEGFTSYAEDYCMSKAFPEKVEKFPNVFFESLEGLINFSKKGKSEVMGILDDNYNSSTAFSMAKYVKGEAFLVQLGYIVGEENLRKIMLEYFNVWKFKHPNERDFMNIAQKISGMDLKWYFNAMIFTNKTIDYSIEKVDVKDKITEVTLKRIGEFPMPIDVLVELKNGQKYYYTIPLSMMRSEKKQDMGMKFLLLPDWGWTRPEYTFNLPYKKEDISKIVLDPTFRMADINAENNTNLITD